MIDREEELFIEYMQQFEDPSKRYHMHKVMHFKKVCTLVTSNFLYALLMVQNFVLCFLCVFT